MGHNTEIDPSKPNIVGKPLHPVEGDDVEIVEGTRGNAIPLNDDDIFISDSDNQHGGEFYILAVAEKGQSAQKVAENLRKKHKLLIKPFVPNGEPADPTASTFEIAVDPDRSHHYLDQEVRGNLRFRPDLKHLSATFGNDADYFLISCKLPNDREAIFGREFRTVTDAQGQPTGENINTRLFDLVQQSIDGKVEVLHRGGLAVFDRQDPDGNPDDLRFASLADLHLAARTDEFEKGVIVKLKDQTLYLGFNNANANFVEAIIPWINEERRQGRLDFVVTLGDNTDFNGRYHEVAGEFVDSNDYLFARFLDSIEVPVFTIPGNHERRPEGHPAWIKPGDFNLSRSNVKKLEGRYLNDVVGSFLFVNDAIDTIMATPNALIGYFDVVNPFPDFSINLGRGDPNSPDSKEARIVMFDTGADDLAHQRQDDPIYKDLQFWPWQFPYLHLITIWQSITHATPDMRGLNDAQISWLSSQIAIDSHTTLLSHAPLLNSTKHYNYDPKKKITPLEEIKHEDLTHGTTAHSDPMVRMIADSPNVRTYVGGHTHSLGNAYALGIDSQNNVRTYRGPLLEGLDQIPHNDADLVHHFWFPREDCPSSCIPVMHSLFGEEAENLRNHKVAWQVGSAGLGTPTFSVLTLNPEGLISRHQPYYVNKVLKKDPKDPSKRVVRRVVAKKPLSNDRLVQEWEKLKKGNPDLVLDMDEALPRINDRLRTDDASFLPRPESLNKYPRYNEEIEYPFISPTKINPHFKIRFHGLSLNWNDQEGLGLLDDTKGLSAEYLFSQDQIGWITRTLLLEGVEIGWLWNGEGTHQLYAGLRTPTVVDWQMTEHLILRGVNFSVGAGVEIPGGDDDTNFYFHNSFHLAEFNYHRDSFELSLDVGRRNVFSGDGKWQWTAGVDFTF